jgi:ABC-type glycerol-3-phosphate transport system permease component
MSSFRKAIVFGVLALVAITTLYPLVFLALTALRTVNDYTMAPFGWPQEWTLDNFATLIANYGVLEATLNSLTAIVFGVTLSVSASVAAAFALVKLDLPFRKVFSGAFVSVLLVPSQILIIPLYLILAQLGMIDTLAGVVFVYVGTTIPFGTFFMSVTMRGVPDELIEAAKIGGAGFFRTLLLVVVPVARTGIFTLIVLTFLSMWNELLFGYILLPSEANQLLTPRLANIGGRFVTNEPVLMAALLMTALPPVLMLIAMSRSLVSGVTEGAVR